MNAGALCYFIGFIVALLALFGQIFGLDLKTVIIVLALICLAPLVSGIALGSRAKS